MIRKALAALSILAAAALTLTLGDARRARANLVTNGSFESTTNSFGAGQKAYFGNVLPTAWSIVNGSSLTFLDAPGTADNGSYLSVYGPFPNTSPDGGNFVEADGDPGYSSTIYQTIHGLTAGQTYVLTFDQAAGQQSGFGGTTTEEWKVGLGDTLATTTNYQYSSKFSLAQGGVGQWEGQTMTFTADSATEVLSFLAVGTNGGPPISFLDGVSLNPSAVPEPPALVLFGLGLFAVAAVRRFRGARPAVS